MMFLGFEQRWIAAILSSFAPEGGEGLAPEPGEVDWVAAADGMISRSTFKARLGYRVGLWLMTLSPVWMLGRLCLFGSLSAAERAAVLERAVGHRLFLVRGLTMVLKLSTCLAMFRSPGVRARSHYDRRETDAAATERSQRRRRGLPVVGAVSEAPVGHEVAA